MVIFEREKKKTTRVGILWDRTRASLNDWISNNSASDLVFLSNYGTGFTAQGLRSSFRRDPEDDVEFAIQTLDDLGI